MTATTHRVNNSTKENQIVGGIPVYATRYASGRTQVNIHNGAPLNAEQAAALGFGDDA